MNCTVLKYFARCEAISKNFSNIKDFRFTDGAGRSHEQHLRSSGRDCDSRVGSTIKNKIKETGCCTARSGIQFFKVNISGKNNKKQ